MSRQIGVRALYMRGGTSKGVFFTPEDLPEPARQPGPARDAFFLRVIGSPDPYGKHTDGMGGATSSTSKVVIVGKSARPDCDVDYLFGQVAVGQPVVDWSGNCGNLVAAVGPFAIERGLVTAPERGSVRINIWQANLGERIVAEVPVEGGQLQEEGDFELDGVAFSAPAIKIEFLNPGSGNGAQALFPTGQVVDSLVVGDQVYEVTLITAGNPTIFVDAAALGLSGTELAAEVDSRPDLLGRLEQIRANGAVRMGLAATLEEATLKRPHTPKLCLVSAPQPYRTSTGQALDSSDVDVVARILSMGKLHHAITGTGAVALAAAAAIPGTVTRRFVGDNADTTGLRIGHPSGRLVTGTWVFEGERGWQVERVVVERSTRRLMDGQVFVSESCLFSSR